MNALAVVRALLWLLSAALLTASLERAQSASNATSPSMLAQSAVVATALPAIRADSLDVLADRIVDGDVFRITRRPSPIPFGAGAVATLPPPPKPARPALALSGIIGGPPWTGLLDGVPGHDQSVLVHGGDTLGGLHIRTVTAHRVVVVGLDTVWHLTVHQPWQ